ncbi:histidine kinase [Microbacterium betulae]|uniref:histidine kinase n=1 Tax=Microbacterium betulae TaxID=2981139 RepID=A0AA97I6G9_9MICO|nr:histidine kinase [Microbacterium sp. AB]WOF22440.1 histidine kinase [Microbacterium sp. AB]
MDARGSTTSAPPWRRALFRPVSPGQWVADAALGALFLLGAVVFLPVADGFWGGGSLAVVVLMTAALMLSRCSPPLALAVAWAGALFQMGTGQMPMVANLAVFVVLFATAAYGSRLVFWAGFASAFAGALCIALYLFVVAPYFGGDFFSLSVGSGAEMREAVFGAVLVFVSMLFSFLLAWTFGALFRVVVRGRETRRAQVLAEERAAAEQERGRIARDMHDVVAHSLAVVVAQADGARYAASADPEAATQALATISQTARSALSDVRMLLTQLRHRQAEGPQPTIADLEQLYAHVRAAGVDLRVTVDPAPPGEPPAAVQLAVYRILQEATTNALRHGDGGPVDVTLAWLPASVVLSVRNGRGPVLPVLPARPADPGPIAGDGPAASGPRPAAAPRAASGDGRAASADPAARVSVLHGPPAASAGHGLIGMRERAELVGGHLDAGPHGRHWLVQATLPVAAGA